MKRTTFIVLALAMVFTFASAATAQNTPPCKPLAEDRTITFCYPVDDANLSVDAVINWGWIKGSLPHTSNMYFDGAFQAQIPDIFNGGIGLNFDDKLHNLTIVVTDAQGTFSKTVSFRQTLQLPCAIPSKDKSIEFCKPSDQETGPSPVRIAAVGRSSVGVSYMQVWIDGAKPVADATVHTAGTANVKMINQFYYLSNGTHTITVIAKQADGTSIKSTHKVNVVSYTP